ncbi:hypothetical protein LDENG_00050080 [Lucifuga dentata]|nr:hypothetical protein LDENG_00050080 [Lucifuga dentata]
MAKQECKPGEYLSQDGRCCDRCPAGKYVRSDCGSNKKTECVECRRGLYTATKNQLYECLACTDCHSNNKKRTVKQCAADEDTVCECVPGFYCSDARCEHCCLVTRCPVGEGVKVKATRMNDTICAPCEEGTYSNVSDFQSTCQTHTRCEDLGRVMKIPGMSKADAICGHFKSNCPWILPAGLWSGLVLTSLVLLVVLCWRTKRKSHRAARSSVPVYPLELPLLITELNGLCQESCKVEGCETPLFHPDNVVSFCKLESTKSVDPRSLQTASVSFSESNHINETAENGTSSCLRTHSEPEEDEWCGT